MIKLVTERRKKDVGFITDVDADFVSLVRHGANQQPFRIVKNEEGGEQMQKITQIVQSVLLPTDTDVTKFISRKGLEYLAEAVLDNPAKFEGYVRYDQVPMEKVDGYKLLKVEGGWLVVGHLKEGVQVENALTLTDEQIQKLADIPLSPAVADGQFTYGPSFMESVDREIFAMLDTIGGSLKQANLKDNIRRKTVVGAIDAFRSFMGVALDALGNEKASTEKIDNLIKALKGETDNQGGDVMPELFKTKEEFTAAVQEVLTAGLDAFTKKLDDKFVAKTTDPEPKAKAADPALKADPDPEYVKMKADFDEAQKKIKALEEKMGEFLGSDPAGEPGDPKKEEEDPELVKNPFKGMLTKKMAA